MENERKINKNHSEGLIKIIEQLNVTKNHLNMRLDAVQQGGQCDSAANNPSVNDSEDRQREEYKAQRKLKVMVEQKEILSKYLILKH